MSESVPDNASDFPPLTLGEIAHIEMGQSPDSAYVIDDPFVGYPFLQGNAEFGVVFPEPKYGCLRPTKLCKTNDVLISVRAPVGAVNLADRDYCIGRGLAAIRLKDVKSSFFGEVLARHASALRKISQGTTFEAINKKDLLTLSLKLPPQNEWACITGILDSLNAAINETEAIIVKLKAVKQGLLHDLLTRGIDVNGELRPPQAVAPHLYKPSQLGWIPNEWEEVRLGEIARRSGGLIQTGPFGSQLHSHEYVPDGIPVIMPQDLMNGELSVASIARVNRQKAISLSRHRVQLNDLVISRRGDLSRCIAIEREHIGWLCGTGCLLARLPVNEVNGSWLALVYPQRQVQSQVMGRAVGSTMANLNTSILAAITINRPPIEEQDEIVKRVKSVIERIKQEDDELRKRRLEKSGLMTDLLTGRVRVTPLLQGVAS